MIAASNATRAVVGMVGVATSCRSEGKPGGALTRESTRAGSSDAGRATTRRGGNIHRAASSIRTEGTPGLARIAARDGGSKPLIYINKNGSLCPHRPCG